MKNIIVSEEDFLKTYVVKSAGYRAIELCKKNKWLPLRHSSILASTVGHLMGDGNLSKDRMVGDFRFYGTLPKLDKIKNSLKKQFNLNPHSYYLHPKGGGYILRYNNAIFSRILDLIDVPRGNKLLVIFKVPKWIMKGDKEIKKAFLGAIFADELGKVYRTKRGGLDGFRYKMAKDKNKINDLVYFLEQLKQLLCDLEVTSSKVRIEKNRPYFRKDGYITNQAVFKIDMNLNNRRRFYFNVGFGNEKVKQKLLYSSLKLNNINEGVPEPGQTGRFCCEELQ